MGDSKVVWYGIRTVYLFKAEADGTNLFEERIVTFSGATWEEAVAKAEAESKAYAAGGVGMKLYPSWDGYIQDGDTLIDGYEVWSKLYQSRVELDEFFEKRYIAWERKPE